MAQRKAAPGGGSRKVPATPKTKPVSKKSSQKPKTKTGSQPKSKVKPQTVEELRDDIIYSMVLNPSYFRTVMATSQENVVALIKRQRRVFQNHNESQIPNYGVGPEPPPEELTSEGQVESPAPSSGAKKI